MSKTDSSRIETIYKDEEGKHYFKGRYWEIHIHPRNGFYPLEFDEKTKKPLKVFGGERYNHATPDLVKSEIFRRINYLNKADISPVKKIENFGRNYRKRK